MDWSSDVCASDLEAPDGAPDAIAKALARHALPQTPEAVAQVGDLVARALNVPLPGTATRARLPASRRVAAMEFHFRLPSTPASALYAPLVEPAPPRATPPSRTRRPEARRAGKGMA